MKKGIPLIITGGILFALGSFVIPIIASIYLITSTIDKKMFEIHPPSFQLSTQTVFTAEEPGRYYLWNDYQTIYNGHSYNLDKELPNGIEFKFTDKDSGKPFVFKGYTGMSESCMGSSRVTIGYINVTNACSIIIDISGNSEDRIFSFSRSAFSGKGILGFIATILTTLLIAIILVITGIIISSKKQKPPQLPHNK